MTGDSCRDDAAYILGALSPSERRVYEAHLADCSSCRRSVRELAGLPGLLSKVRPGDFESADDPPPPTLLPSLVRAVRRRRSRRVWLVGGLAAVAAAMTAVLVAFGVRGVLAPANRPVDGVAMAQVSETAIHARASLSAKPWGTRIDLFCSYDRSSPYSHPDRTYALMVTDDVGRTRQVATWKAVPDGMSTVTGSIGWDRADIAEVEVRALDGAPVLRLTT